MAEIFEKNTMRNPFFNTVPYGDPLKIKISKTGLHSDLSWPKLGIEPQFHDHVTFGGFGKQITDRQTITIHVV